MKNKSIIFSLLLVVGIHAGCQEKSQTISSEEFMKRQLPNETITIDVRTPEEYNEGHIPNAINLDYNGGVLEKSIATLDKSKTFLVYCKSGKRSNAACQLLNKEGFTVYNLHGGINEWTGDLIK